VAVEPPDADVAAALEGVEGVVTAGRDDELWLVGAQRDVRAPVASRLTERGLTIVHLRQRTEELGAIYRRYFAEEGAQ
jgi:hypothetical protein